jgi:putative transposase
LARLPRLVVAGLPHLIIHRGLSGQAVFLDDVDRAQYRLALTTAAREADMAVHGYGLAANEVRLLATPSVPAALGAMMQSVGRRYVRLFNLRHGRSGTPWEGRFRSTVVDASARFLSCLRFAEVGGTAFAAVATEMTWSSVAHHLGEQVDPLISEHEAFWAIGNTPFEREAAYRQYLEQPLPQAESDLIREAGLKGWALGSPAFAAVLGAETGRRMRPLPRGRPKRGAGAIVG